MRPATASLIRGYLAQHLLPQATPVGPDTPANLTWYVTLATLHRGIAPLFRAAGIVTPNTAQFWELLLELEKLEPLPAGATTNRNGEGNILAGVRFRPRSEGDYVVY